MKLTTFLSLTLLTVGCSRSSGTAPKWACLDSIQPGVSETEVLAVLTKGFPQITPAGSMWSGQTGYIDFMLDKRLRLSIAAEFDKDGKKVVHPSVLLTIHDSVTGQRVELENRPHGR